MDTVFDASFTADGSKLLAGGADRALRLWDLSTGRVLHTLTGHAQKVRFTLLRPVAQASSSIICMHGLLRLCHNFTESPPQPVQKVQPLTAHLLLHVQMHETPALVGEALVAPANLCLAERFALVKNFV